MFVKIISFYKICTENVKKRIISGCNIIKQHPLTTRKTVMRGHIYIRCNHFWQKILYSLLNA
ncbi:unknown [Prevotella sp. CAG:592]|nr:unknown [Prevotella sp. CAG:592]